MGLEYSTDAKGLPTAIPSGSAPTFAADLTEIAAYFGEGRTFRKFASQSAMNSATGMDDGDLAQVDTIDQAYFRYDGSTTTWVMVGCPNFASTGARDSAISAPHANMRCTVGKAEYFYTGSAWVILAQPWTSYSPTVSNFSSASTPATITGRYSVTGGICTMFVQGKLGTGAITVGGITVSLPVAADTTGMILDSTHLAGAAGFTDVNGTSGDTFGGLVRIVDANTVRPLREVSAGQFRAVASTAPFTWATLDEFSLMCSYPVA